MLAIRGGCVYDPLNSVRGEVKDIYIEEGKVVAGSTGPDALVDEIDARGQVVMPGGVEIHSHVAGPKVNMGRVLSPEDHRINPVAATEHCRSGVGGMVPSTFVTGYRYAAMGYTTVFEAAMPPLEARHVHEELQDIPLVDRGALTLMGNNHFVLSLVERGEQEKLQDFVAWLLEASGGYGVKVVNPGGVVNWKHGGNVSGLDDYVQGYGVTPRMIIDALVEANEALGLPHPVHLHCNNLGQPGSDAVARDTIKLAAGRRLYITHLQFSSYSGGKDGRLVSSAADLTRVLDATPSLVMDVGQIVFGPAMTMTADGPLQHRLYQWGGKRWSNKDVENETGSGVVPLEYRKKSYVNTLQWCIGLELFLRAANPWQVFMSTDHPNAGPFTAYPEIIRLLMDRDYREEVALSANRRAVKDSGLLELDRTYSLEEIAIITRAGPARSLGLKNKGHLGPGADADVAIYRPQEDQEAMFARPALVLKDGEPVARDGQVLTHRSGRVLLTRPPGRAPVEEWLEPDFQRLYSISLGNYRLEPERLPAVEVIACE